jgi:hypothetical protein
MTVRSLSFAELQQQVTPEMPFRRVLENNRATLLFASDELFADAWALILEDAKSRGWKIIGMQHDCNTTGSCFLSSSGAGRRSAIPGRSLRFQREERLVRATSMV